jgi:hypothetical protein
MTPPTRRAGTICARPGPREDMPLTSSQFYGKRYRSGQSHKLGATPLIAQISLFGRSSRTSAYR